MNLANHFGRIRFALAGLALAGGRVAAAQTTERVSVDPTGTQADKASSAPSISGDGNLVAFVTTSQLVAADTNTFQDVYVHDRTSGTTTLVSVDASGGAADSDSFDPAISADGNVVAFWSKATDLVASDTNGFADSFVRDLSAGVTELISVDSNESQGGFDSHLAVPSADGSIVAFETGASFVAGDSGRWDVYVRDRVNGTTEVVSVDSSGSLGGSDSNDPSISSDGNVVAFSSYANNLASGDTNGLSDVFVHDRTTGVTEMVSVDSSGVQGGNTSFGQSMSADGRFIAFDSDSINFVPGDVNARRDVFVHDRATGMTQAVSVNTSGATGSGDSYEGTSISADGRFVAFRSYAWDLVPGDGNGHFDIFVRDLALGTTARASVDSNGVEATAESSLPAISAEGDEIAFASKATNLVTPDTNNANDVFVREPCDASWANYGDGLAGTLGIPTFTASADPVLNTTIDLVLSNSAGKTTIAVIFLGFERAATSIKGGTLLVDPFLLLALSIPTSGLTLPTDIPNDVTLCGLDAYLQALEVDAGAVKKLSFTRGLQLKLGK